MDDHLDGIARDGIVPAVDALFQLLARQDRAGMLHESMQQGELARRQRRARVAIDDLARPQIELQRLGPNDGLRVAVTPSDRRAQSRQELAQLEWLDDVIVGTEIEP